MTIGINAAAALKQPRTGVEEYTYQLIKHLTMLPEAREHRFLLYLPRSKGYSSSEAKRVEKSDGKVLDFAPLALHSNNNTEKRIFDLPLPDNFEIKILYWPLPFLWTQIRLAWEMLWCSPEILFIPVHILPFLAPKKSIVTIHGLEYEYFPEHYPLWHRRYLRWSTKYAVRQAAKIIAISANTKQDLIKLYGAESEKIEVVHHGVSFCHSEAVGRGISRECGSCIREGSFPRHGGVRMTGKDPYILYIGRVETKKNIQGLLEAYKILKEKYNIPHQLVLAGARGYGYEDIKFKIKNLKLKIIELGYISEEEKWQLLSDADLFVFPSFYEGFGLPVLEAQVAGVPVVCSDNSSLREITGRGALLVNPRNNLQIVEAIKQAIDDNVLRDKLRQSGWENIKRFDWEKCARETLSILLGK
ncbi:MAG TPA: hypothetical protein DHI91_01290 [Candidatus Portnoybacteria bacterium]|nr:hypothetical protein [Candidatus Portnoybacteria bacterium]